MPSLNVNDQTCTRCGICTANCPLGVITLRGSEAPAFVPGGDSRCMVCGHCEALCPSHSISVADPELSDRTYPLHGVNLTPAQLGEYLRNRRSIRSYRETSVDRAVIEELFDIVRYAPTARNT